MPRPTVRFSRAHLAVVTLLLSSAACLLLLVARSWALNEHGFGFIPKNLLLAWIPMVCSLLAFTLCSRGEKRPWLLAGAVIVWFLFYPNAPYLVTDLVHLPARGIGSRLFFDDLLMASFAWTGIALGNLSLFLIHEVVRVRRGNAFGWGFAVAMLAAGSTGVYFGRFWRWNSKDVLLRPSDLAKTAAAHLREWPLTQTATFFLTFFLFSFLTYATVFSFAHLRADPLEEDLARQVSVTAWSRLRMRLRWMRL